MKERTRPSGGTVYITSPCDTSSALRDAKNWMQRNGKRLLRQVVRKYEALVSLRRPEERGRRLTTSRQAQRPRFTCPMARLAWRPPSGGSRRRAAGMSQPRTTTRAIPAARFGVQGWGIAAGRRVGRRHGPHPPFADYRRLMTVDFSVALRSQVMSIDAGSSSSSLMRTRNNTACCPSTIR